MKCPKCNVSKVIWHCYGLVAEPFNNEELGYYDIIYEGCCIEEPLEYDYECAECKYKWLGEEDE